MRVVGPVGRAELTALIFVTLQASHGQALQCRLGLERACA